MSARVSAVTMEDSDFTGTRLIREMAQFTRMHEARSAAVVDRICRGAAETMPKKLNTKASRRIAASAYAVRAFMEKRESRLLLPRFIAIRTFQSRGCTAPCRRARSYNRRSPEGPR